MLHTKKGRGILYAVFAVAYFLLFLLHYEISLFVESDTAVEIVSYIVYLFVATCSACSAAVLVRLLESVGNRAFVSFLWLTLTRLAYQIPYYYIYYISDYYSSGDAILLGALMGLIEVGVLYVVYTALVLLVRRIKKGGSVEIVWPSLVLCVYELCMLIYEIVLYLISYQGVVFFDDIPYFLFGFVYCALLLCASYFASYLLTNYGFKKPIKGE